MKIARRFIRNFEKLPHRCAIIAYEDNGKLARIKHVWDHLPAAKDLAYSAEWKTWFNESYAALEAQYGPGSLKGVPGEQTALEDNSAFTAFQQAALEGASKHEPSGEEEEKQISRRTFTHRDNSYECAISVRLANGSVQHIQFIWDWRPPKSPRYLEGEVEWVISCLTAIDASFGVGSVERAKARVCVGDSNINPDSALWRTWESISRYLRESL